MRVELINKLAVMLQENGFESPIGRQAWGRLVEEIYPVVKKRADNYARNHSEKARVDADTLLSIGLYEGIKRTLHSWDVNKGEFVARMNYILPYVFLDHVRAEVNTEKRKAVTTATSLSTPIDGDGITLEDTLVDKDQCLEELLLPTKTSELFGSYAEEHGEERAEVARIIFLYHDDLPARNKLLCKYYGVADYSATIRKRVERSKKHFIDFCIKNKELVGLTI